MPIDIERATYALNEALMTYIVARSSFDDVDDTVEFLVNEIQDSGIELSIEAKDGVDARTLEELEAHPLTSLLRTHLCDLMDVPANDVPFVLEDFLDTYQRGIPEVSEEEEEDHSNERICELCERPAPLTEHHLIPRTEHALMIKRGIFTQAECQRRISMLCRPCHSACHRARTTRELAVDFNTVEKLLEIPEVARFAEWNSKRKVLVKAVQKRKRR